LQRAQAAIVTVRTILTPEPDDIARLNLQFANSGHETASDVQFGFVVGVRNIKSDSITWLDQGYLRKSEYPLAITRGPENSAIDYRFYTSPDIRLPISAKSVQALKRTELAIRIEGTLSYTDGFEHREECVCHDFIAVKGFQSEIASPASDCDDYATTLKSALIQKRANESEKH
jgi:hypothetical protein